MALKVTQHHSRTGWCPSLSEKIGFQLLPNVFSKRSLPCRADGRLFNTIKLRCLTDVCTLAGYIPVDAEVEQLRLIGMLANYLMLVVYLQVLQQLSHFCQNSAAISNKVS